MTEPNPNIKTLREAARIVGVSVDTLERYIAKGAVTLYRTPSGRRYVDWRECLPRPAPRADERGPA